MNAIALSLSVVVVALLMACHWWAVRRHFVKKLQDAQEKHLLHKQQAAELLSAAKQQVANLKHQLAGARLEAKRAERHRVPIQAQAPSLKANATESLLMMLDDESSAASRGFANAFADTTIKY